MRLADLLRADVIDEPFEPWLAGAATVVRRFGERIDSRADVWGVELDDARVVVKHADVDPESVGWLESALRFHTAVEHPAIARLHGHLRTAGAGLALVHEWVPGEVLSDPFDPAVADRDEVDSPYRRFRALEPALLVDHVATILDAHVAVAAAGFVAVDFYDGCVIHDPDARRVHLVDLDAYRAGPYVLDVDRQLGSTSLMAPEEFDRGALIDERTTVFTLARFALVALGCARHGPPARADFRADDRRFELALTATDPDPTNRVDTVAGLAGQWRGGAR